MDLKEYALVFAGTITLHLPVGARVLGVVERMGSYYATVLEDTALPKWDTYTINVAPVWSSMPEDPGEYLGALSMGADHKNAVHIFCKKKEEPKELPKVETEAVPGQNSVVLLVRYDPACYPLAVFAPPGMDRPTALTLTQIVADIVKKKSPPSFWLDNLTEVLSSKGFEFPLYGQIDMI